MTDPTSDSDPLLRIRESPETRGSAAPPLVTASENAAARTSRETVEQPGGHTILQAGSRVNIHERDPRTGKLLRKRLALVKYTGEAGFAPSLLSARTSPARCEPCAHE